MPPTDDRPSPRTVVVSAVDRWGRDMVAYLGRWESHVEQRHPELDEHFDAVDLALRDPEVITLDAVHPNRENFYRRGALPPPYDRLYLKVCMAMGGRSPRGLPTTGEVVTAYPTPRVGRGEAQKWP